MQCSFKSVSANYLCWHGGASLLKTQWCMVDMVDMVLGPI